MQLETDQHWYALFGFFFTQQTDEAKLEIMQPWTREKVLVEMFDILKNGRDDRLKINLLIFLEENTSFFFATHPTVFQGTCTLLNELLTLPTVPKVTGNPRDPSTLSYSPYTPNHVKTQVLMTLTTILITSETIHRQPSTIESLVDILFEIITHVNDSADRLLRQTAAEALRELSMHFSGLLISRLGLLFRLAKEERMHAKLSYTTLFSTALISSLQCIQKIGENTIINAQQGPINDQPLAHFENTLQSLGLQKAASTLRLLAVSNEPELPSFSLPSAAELGQAHNFGLSAQPILQWLPLLRTDLESAATYLLDQIQMATVFEAVRLTQHLAYLLQVCFVSRETFDAVADGSLAPLHNRYNSIATFTEIPVKRDKLETVVRWALQSSVPVLWTIAQILLARLPVRFIQPSLPPKIIESDMIATTQPLTLMLRDNLLLLSKTFSASASEGLRSQLLEWLTRRPVHSDAENCVYLLTTPPFKQGTGQAKERTRFVPDRAGSKELATHFASKRSLVLPTPFDSLLSVQAKLVGLAYCYASQGAENRVPKSFMRVMSVFNDFPLQKSSSVALFRLVTHYLLNFPSIFDAIMTYLECILQEHPKFADQVWEVVQVIGSKNRILAQAAVLRLCRFLALLAPPNLFNYLPLILKMVKLRHTLVDVLLEALRLNLRCSVQTREGNWSFGHTILEIVHTILLHHDIRAVLTPACNLLALLGRQYGDVEIRDRASFYLQLLTHVPADRIRAIIEVTSQSMAENLDVDNPFVNTEASKLQAAGFHPLTFKSSLPGDSSTATSPTPPNLLTLEKTSPSFNLNSLALLNDARNIDHSDDSQLEVPILPSYYHALSLLHGGLSETEPISKIVPDEGRSSTFSEHVAKDSLDIQIPFLLRFKTPSEIRKDGGDLSNLPLSLYSLTLSMTGSTLYSNRVHSVDVPFLASRVKSAADLSTLLIQDLKGEDASSNTSIQLAKLKGPRYGTVSSLLPTQGGSVFPFSFSFVLSLQVLLPLPTFLDIKATANTPEGAVAEFTMEPIPICLKDLFVPLPPQLCGTNSYGKYLHTLFEEMWALLSKEPQATNSKKNVPSDVVAHDNISQASDLSQYNIRGTSSVKYVSKPLQSVIDAIQAQLSPFLIPSKSSPSTEAVLIFLPHKYHLLLSFEIGETSTVVRIRTDWWRILPHLDKFFDDLFR